jgi:hypothetical protein
MRRFWKLAMVVAVGVAPGAFSGCFQLYPEKVNFLNGALATPWDPATGFVSTALTPVLNPGSDKEWQKMLNTIYASIQTVIRSEIAVETPQGWVDVGRPR